MLSQSCAGCVVAQQMAQYQHGEYYAAHSDFTTEDGYDRVATFLIYLSDVDDGGETVRLAQARALWPRAVVLEPLPPAPAAELSTTPYRHSYTMPCTVGHETELDLVFQSRC